MNIEVTKKLLARYDYCEKITDEECEALYKFYLDLSNKLKLLGPTFDLAYLPLKVLADRFEGYSAARSAKKRQENGLIP
jgi:hypothetical protein